MRGFASLIILSIIGIAPAVSVQAADNRCAYLEAQGKCICAIPQEWVQNNVVGIVTGDAMVTGPAGFSPTPGPEGTIPVGDPGTIVAGAGGASLTMGQCIKDLPQNVTVYVDKQDETCECAHLAGRAVVPWWPAGVAAATGIIVVVTIPGGEVTPP
jgi:hypothetical protein